VRGLTSVSNFRKVRAFVGRSHPAKAARHARAQELLGLFAYHRDAPLVARSLGLSLSELEAELDTLKIRRRAFLLARGVQADFPRATAIPGARSGPTVRRRSKGDAPPPPAPKPARPSEKEEQAGALRELLSKLGARRSALAARLGTSEAALLARFRAAGLEREFSLRERDLVRALYSRHRAAEERIAAEMRTTVEGLRRLVSERGLSRELEAMRERVRRKVR
jgi:hypothetical protein